MAGTLHIQLLGDFRLTYDDEPVAVNSQRVQSLLAYLVLQRGAPASRQKIAYSFWPDSREKQALANLRTLLYHLRQALPDADQFLGVDAKTLTWKAEAPFSLDVVGFEQALAEAEEAIQRAEAAAAERALDEAAELYRGDLLAGLYEDWIFPEREHLHGKCTHALERLARLLEDGRDYSGAIRWAERLLRHDPLREPSYRLLMRLHALAGDRAGAVRVYRTCVEMLQRELELDPEPATQELFKQLMHGEVTSGEEVPPSDAPETEGSEVPLVGRRQQWRRLRTAWRKAADGRAHLVTVCGEAGIGKTRLTHELLNWAARQGIATARARSYAAEGRLAYAPVTEWLRAEAVRPYLVHLDAVWQSEVVRLLPELRIEHPELLEPGPLVESWQRQRFFESLARSILASGKPLLLLLDDMQWSDQETLEWLRFLLRFAPEARLLIVGTIRTEEVDAAHPLRSLLLDLGRAAKVTEVELERLEEAETAQLAAHVAGRALSEEQAALLHRETEGNPLFVVERVRAGLPTAEPTAPSAGPDWREPAQVSTVPDLPPTVQNVITMRLAQLSPAARAVVGLAAAVGRTFSYEVLLEAAYTGEEQLVEALDELWQRRILRELKPGVYDFMHDKIREVAYAEIGPVRRRLLHRRVAQALSGMNAADSTTGSGQSRDGVSAQVAAHYEQGGLYEEAVSCYRKAAEAALRVFADAEAVRQLRRALDLLQELPEDQARGELEVELLTALGSALVSTRGWAHPAVEETYERAHTLCQNLEADERIFACLWGLWTFRLVRAELKELHELTARFLRMAQEQPSGEISVAAHLAGFFNAFFLGDLPGALEHMDGALAQPEFDKRPVHVLLMSSDERVFCHSCAAHVLWFLGYPDQALKHAGDALELADASGHPFNQTIARCYAAMLHQHRREPDAVEDLVREASALCDAYGFAYYSAWCIILEGWVLAERGAIEEGIVRMRQGLLELRDTGAVLREPYYLGLLAEAEADAGRIDEGLEFLTHSLDAAERRGERWIEAELYRLRGKLMLLKRADEEAEAAYRKAEDVARRQQARSPALLAAMGLGRLWHLQGKTAEARLHLEQSLSWFTEGHDTPDHEQAAALLAEWE